MSAHKHTPGEWHVGGPHRCTIYDKFGQRLANSFEGVMAAQRTDSECAADARLIAAAPELLEALREAVDLAWIPDSRIVEFDPTVRFGPYYDYAGLDESTQRQEFHGQYECIVWPGRKWSAYCTYEGSLWFEQFDTAAEAKEKCMALLDRLIPGHPAMKARAAIAKATGEPA